MKLDIPIYIIGSHDPLVHTTQADINYLVQHEIDLYEEGEETTLTRKEYLSAKKYLKKHSSP